MSSRSLQLLALLALLAAPSTALASHGVVTLFQQDSALGTALARDGSGRILVGGDTGAGAGFGVVRLSAKGRLDKTFGSHGIAKVAVGKSDFNDLTSVVALPDGSILASGTVGTDSSTNGGAGTLFGVARLTRAGKLDTSFGESGTRRFTLKAGMDDSKFAALMPDGHVLIGGDSGDGASIHACVASFDTDLVQNPAFTPSCGDPDGTEGAAYYGDAAPDAGGTTVLSIGGSAPGGGPTPPPAFGIARLTASGAADTSFGTQGATVVNFGGSPHDGAQTGKRPLVARPGGGWIVGGTTKSDFGLVGFTAGGAVDPAFGSGGKVEIDADGTPGRDVLVDLVPLKGGRFLAVGQSEKTSRNGGQTLELACVDASGKLVKGFGRGGRETLTAAKLGLGDLEQIDDALALPDGSVLITGATYIRHYAMVVMRLKPNGRLDRSFG